jgi:hypothetical protein
MKKSVNFNGQSGKRGRSSRGISGFVALAKFVGMKDDEIIESAKKIEAESHNGRALNSAAKLRRNTP